MLRPRTTTWPDVQTCTQNTMLRSKGVRRLCQVAATPISCICCAERKAKVARPSASVEWVQRVATPPTPAATYAGPLDPMHTLVYAYSRAPVFVDKNSRTPPPRRPADPGGACVADHGRGGASKDGGVQWSFNYEWVQQKAGCLVGPNNSLGCHTLPHNKPQHQASGQ